MITSSPMLGAMGLGVKAVERRSDFEQNAMNLRRVRDEALYLDEIRRQARESIVGDGEDQS